MRYEIEIRESKSGMRDAIEWLIVFAIVLFIAKAFSLCE